MPLLRSDRDDRPIAWREWFFVSVVIPTVMLLLGALALVSIPVMMLYPELCVTEYDDGTPRQQELMRRFRRYASRVSFWRRCGRLLAYPFRRRRLRRIG